MKHALEAATADAEQPTGDRHVAHRRFHVGDVLPARLFADDLRHLFGHPDGTPLSLSRFYELQAAGRFDRFLLKPTIGRRAWSGAKVMAHFEAERKAN